MTIKKNKKNKKQKHKQKKKERNYPTIVVNFPRGISILISHRLNGDLIPPLSHPANYIMLIQKDTSQGVLVLAPLEKAIGDAPRDGGVVAESGGVDGIGGELVL